MLFAGVSWPNSMLLSRIAVYAVSESSGLSVALPKYFFPAVFASAFKPAVELGVVAPVVLVGVLDVVCNAHKVSWHGIARGLV